MYSTIAYVVSASLMMPTHARAASGFWESAVGGATLPETGVHVESAASASTGGQRADSGERVVTGESSASVHTRIRSNESGGEARVEIETSRDGKKQRESYTKEFNRDEAVHIRVATSSHTSDDRMTSGSGEDAHRNSDTPTDASIETSANSNAKEITIQRRTIFGALVDTPIARFFARVMAFVWPF